MKWMGCILSLCFMGHVFADTVNISDHYLGFLDQDVSIIDYDSYVFVHTPEYQRLYDKSLSLQWNLPKDTQRYRSFKILFDRLYMLDDHHKLFSTSLETRMIESVRDLDNIDVYDILYPYILTKDSDKNLAVHSMNYDQPLWSKPSHCNDTFFFSSGYYLGCLSSSYGRVYEVMTGDIYLKTPALNSQWTYESSSNNGAYFSNEDQLVFLEFSSKNVIPLDVSFYDVQGFVRQKEVVKFNDDQTGLICHDLQSNDIRWVYPVGVPIQSVRLNDQAVVIETPSQNMVIDHYTGDTLLTFSQGAIPESWHTFFKDTHEWVFLGDTKAYRMVEETSH